MGCYGIAEDFHATFRQTWCWYAVAADAVHPKSRSEDAPHSYVVELASLARTLARMPAEERLRAGPRVAPKIAQQKPGK